MMNSAGLLGAWLIGLYGVSSIVLIATAILSHVIRQPARRLALAEATLLGLLGLTAVSFASTWRARAFNRGGETPVTRVPHFHYVGPEGTATGGTGTTPSGSLPVAIRCCPSAPGPSEAANGGGPVPPALPIDRNVELDWPVVLAGLWSAGALGSVLWLLAGWLATRRLVRDCEQPTRELHEMLDRVAAGRSLPRLLVTPAPVQPMALGSLRPTIVIPRDFVHRETAESLEAVLAHEWAHIRRGDLRLLFLARILLPFYFAHPAYLWLRSRIRTDLEAVADSWAARGRQHAYAELLLHWARSGGQNRLARSAAALGLWGSESSLRQRIENLTTSGRSIEPETPRLWRGVCRAVAIAAVVAIIPIRGIGSHADLSSTSALEDRAIDCSCAPPSPASLMVCPPEITGPSGTAADRTLNGAHTLPTSTLSGEKRFGFDGRTTLGGSHETPIMSPLSKGG